MALRGADGTPAGTMAKADAHEPPGHLHEAFSVLVFDDRGRTLLQRRASTKYSFAGLWTNACCSHPLPGHELVEQARSRTRAEIGLAPDLELAGDFTYRAEDVASGLVEHEHDTVLVGYVPVGSVPVVDPSEVDETRWVSFVELHADVSARPATYTPWLAQVLETAAAAGHPRA